MNSGISYPTYPNYNYYNQAYYPYQQTYQQNSAVQPSPTVQRKLDFVQGRAAADVYQVDAGQEVILVDMDNPFVYRKARGFDNKLEPMEVYDVILHQESEVLKKDDIDLSSYVTSETLQEALENLISNELEQKIKDEVDKHLSEISFAPTTTHTKQPKKAMKKVGEVNE